MFGIIVMVTIIIFGITKMITNGISDYKDMSRGKTNRNFSNTYRDHNGVARDVDTNEYRYIYGDLNHDKWMEGKGIEPINLSQKKRDEEYNKYRNKIDKGESFLRTAVYYKPDSDKRKLRGPIYKDIRTGKLLVVRYGKRGQYYISIEDGKVLRYIDSYRRFLRQNKKYDENEEQKDVVALQAAIDRAKVTAPWKNLDYTMVQTKSPYHMLIDYWE